MGSDHLSPPAKSESHGSSPILLTKHGEAVIPTVIPPSTEFDDYATSTQPSNAAPEEQNYFDLKPVRKIPTEPFAVHDLDRMPANIRAQTENNAAEVRPLYTSKRTSFFNSFGKKSETGNIDDGRDGFSYAFDPMSSASESSSDEDEPAKKHKHKHRVHRPHVHSAKTEEFHHMPTSDKKRREQARRGRSYSRFAVGNEYLHTKGRVSKRDGRLNISINETSNNGYVAKTLGQSIQNHLDIPKRHTAKASSALLPDNVEARVEDAAARNDMDTIVSSLHSRIPRPRLNIVIMVIGSRGDIQPFVRLAAILKEQHGHRVRIASHPTFREFVEKDAGLEFFSIGGDPSELMAFMVKNPGLIPNLKTIREGEIQRRRSAMRIMFEGFWRACTNTSDDETDEGNLKMLNDKEPFVADAIIANPPSMAHVHIAEKLGIPLHMMFTFPYSPTQQFPHPLANIRPGKSNVDPNYVNFMSYPMVEMMTWQGLGDIVNKFRERTLGLEPVSSLWAPGALYRMRVPYTYLWSPSLVAKPEDWGPEIDIAGFAFLDLASKFKPDKDLESFLNAGEAPVYIGFGSIVVDDPNAFTEMIFEAVKIAGVRALVNKGWGGLGGDGTPDNIFMLENTPHDWLFPRVKAVIHHGGAGTTAIGLKCAKPTMIVPFFGDQPFWGAMVAEAKAGAHECIPYKNLTAEKLAEGIKQCLSEEAQKNVQKIADSIEAEGDGAENAVKSFHRSLNLAGKKTIRCSILEDRVAVWQLRNSALRLSALAATILHQKGKLKMSELKLIRHNEWNDFDGPGEPITGSIGAVKDSLYDMGEGMGMVPVRIAKHIRKHEEHVRKREAREQRRADRKEAKADARELAKMKKSVKDDRNVEQADQAETARPTQPTRTETNNTLATTMSVESAPVAQKVAKEVGKGFEQTGWAFLTMPNDLHVAIARGFHNAPRLWGDSTVRKPIRVTGFKSGCKAAGQEFAFGLWDGCTGLVMQPVGDWKDGVTVPQKIGGIGTGIGKGVGGFLLKTISAVISPSAYFGQGVIRYTEKKMHGPSTKGFLRRAQTVQGSKDLLALQRQDDQEQLKQVETLVLEGWRVFDAIWRIASKEFGLSESDSNLINRVRMSREKRRWQEAGLVENVSTARQALEAYEGGESMEAIFNRRREEVRLADQPRAGVMERPEDPGEEEGQRLAVLPDGRVLTSSYANKKQEEEKNQSDAARQDSRRVEEEEDVSSDATAVEQSDDEHDEDGKERGNKVPGSTMPSKGDMLKKTTSGKDPATFSPADDTGMGIDSIVAHAPKAAMV